MRKGNRAPRAREGEPAETVQLSSAARTKVIKLANLLRSSEPEAPLTDDSLVTFAGQVADEELAAIAGQVADEELAAIAGQVTDEELAAIAADHGADTPAQSVDVLAFLPKIRPGDTRRTYSDRLLKAVN